MGSQGEEIKRLSEVRIPNKKLIVMIIGNHSAGKSSFINWYVGREVQKTKVAIETIEISLLMQGNRDTEINGYNAMHTLPFLKELYDEKTRQEKFSGLLENLQLKAV